MAKTQPSKQPVASVPIIKAQKHRSPNYPVIGLERALQRAQTINAQAKNQEIPVQLALQLWDYKPGVGDQTVAALRSFGLLEVQGKMGDRRVRVTEEARHILGNGPNRDALLKRLALNPTIYQEIWDKYHGVLPEDTVIRNYLVWERPDGQRFSDDSARALLARFRATIAFAKLSPFDNIDNDSDSVNDVQDGHGEAMVEDSRIDEEMRKLAMQGAGVPKDPSNPFSPLPKDLPRIPVGYDSFPLLLSRTAKGFLSIPNGISKKQFELLKGAIQNTLNQIELAYLAEDDEGPESD